MAAFVVSNDRKRLKSKSFGAKVKARQFYQSYRAFLVEMGGVEPPRRSVAVRLASHPFGFFSFWIDYRSRIYPKYHTATHNFVNMIDFYVDRTKWVDFHILFGGALTFKDTDTRTAGDVYKQDWFFFMNFMYQFRLFVHPVRFFSFGTMFGNYSDYQINSFDYWQCDTVLEFYPIPSRRLALTAKFSVINSGGMHFAGYISRLMLTFGGRYEIKI